MYQSTFNAIKNTKVIAIVRGVLPNDICALAEAILAGGLNCIEVTFDHTGENGIENTLRSIAMLKEKFGEDIFVGAGTVIKPEEVQLAKDAGATYIISPNSDESVIKKTKKLGLVSIPGAMTPTEAANAWAWGADIVKLFPAGILGAGYIKALKAPLAYIPFTAVGGITPENTAEFLKAGCIGVGVGGNLVSTALVQQGKFDEITKVSQAYVKAIKEGI